VAFAPIQKLFSNSSNLKVTYWLSKKFNHKQNKHRSAQKNRVGQA